MLCHIFLGDAAVHPAKYEVCTLVQETAYVWERLQAYTKWKTALSVALLRLLQTEFNQSFLQVLER